MGPSRRERTHERLIECAIELFEAHGFGQTTAAQIAAAAGVTEMTFFRHFPTKDHAVTADVYDPKIATAIAAQSASAPPLLRAVRGIRAAFDGLPEQETAQVRRRVRIIAATPALRAATARANQATQDRIAAQLVADGTQSLVAQVAAAAVIGALTAALLEWARDEHLPLASAIDTALRTLESRDE